MNIETFSLALIIAFLGGVVTFISPCILPLIPGYLSFITGVSTSDLKKGVKGRFLKVLVSSLLFVLGFSIVFALLGASASFIGGFLIKHKNILIKVAGGLIIFFGLIYLGVIKIPFFYQERRFQPKGQSFGTLGTVLLGAAFGFAWTPCLGPILSSILLLASITGTATKGAFLLIVYAFGLGIPFIITGLLLSRFLTTFDWIKRHYQVITVVSGSFLILIGILLLTPLWSYFSTFLFRLSSSSPVVKIEELILKFFKQP